jgi:hypothetical protein
MQVSSTPPNAPTARFSVSESVARFRYTPSNADAANGTDGTFEVRTFAILNFACPRRLRCGDGGVCDRVAGYHDVFGRDRDV